MIEDVLLKATGIRLVDILTSELNEGFTQRLMPNSLCAKDLAHTYGLRGMYLKSKDIAHEGFSESAMLLRDLDDERVRLLSVDTKTRHWVCFLRSDSTLISDRKKQTQC